MVLKCIHTLGQISGFSYVEKFNFDHLFPVFSFRLVPKTRLKPLDGGGALKGAVKISVRDW